MAAPAPSAALTRAALPPCARHCVLPARPSRSRLLVRAATSKPDPQDDPCGAQPHSRRLAAQYHHGAMHRSRTLHFPLSPFLPSPPRHLRGPSRVLLPGNCDVSRYITDRSAALIPMQHRGLLFCGVVFATWSVHLRWATDMPQRSNCAGSCYSTAAAFLPWAPSSTSEAPLGPKLLASRMFTAQSSSAFARPIQIASRHLRRPTIFRIMSHNGANPLLTSRSSTFLR